MSKLLLVLKDFFDHLYWLKVKADFDKELKRLKGKNVQQGETLDKKIAGIKDDLLIATNHLKATDENFEKLIVFVFGETIGLLLFGLVTYFVFWEKPKPRTMEEIVIYCVLDIVSLVCLSYGMLSFAGTYCNDKEADETSN